MVHRILREAFRFYEALDSKQYQHAFGFSYAYTYSSNFYSSHKFTGTSNMFGRNIASKCWLGSRFTANQIDKEKTFTWRSSTLRRPKFSKSAYPSGTLNA